MTEAEQIRAAGEMIRECGWHRGGGVGPNGEVCLLWALFRVGRQGPGSPAGVITPVRHELERRGMPRNWQNPVWKKAGDRQPPQVSISGWNDHNAKDVDEVLDVIEAAARTVE